MRNFAILFVAASLAGGVYSLRASANRTAGHSAGVPVPAVSNQLVRVYDARYTAVVHSSLKASYLSDYAANGMAGGGAEFHLLRPHTDPKLREGFLADSVLGSVWHDFYPITPRYELPYQYGPDVEVSPEHVHVGIGDLFSNRLILDAYVVNDGQGLSVEVVFIPAAAPILAALLESQPGYSNVDWFGLVAPGDSAGTEMFAVLVSDETAYAPFSVNALVSQFPQPAPVRVAYGLDQTEAALLVSRLGF